MTDDDAGKGAGLAHASLLERAREVMGRAVCPFSGFRVGVALEAGDGTVHTGANVENASYNLGLCAERVALYHALTHGARDFRRVAIATEAATPTYPCGACRQALWEFAPHAELLLTVPGREVVHTTVAQLLPHGFDAADLARTQGPPSPMRRDAAGDDADGG